MQTYGPSLCTSCARLSEERDPITLSKFKCTAFPNGIPATYLSGRSAHLPGDPDSPPEGPEYQMAEGADAYLEMFLEFHPELRDDTSA